MHRFLKNALGAGFLSLAVSTPVFADPILVTAGTVEIHPGGDAGFATIDITGTQGFSLTAGADPLGAMSCATPCLPGQEVSHSGTVFSPHGEGTLNGLTYPFNPAAGSGVLQMATASYTLPSPDGFGEVTFQTLFTLTPDSFLHFALSDQDPNSFILAVAGSGRATGHFSVQDELGGPEYVLERVTYNFDSPAAVPEPATLLLVGGGLAAIWGRRRRARNVAR